MKYTIDPPVFKVLPGLRVLIVSAHDMQHSESAAQFANERLLAAWNQVPAALSGYANPQSHPLVAAWRKAYAALGLPGSKYTTSVEALLKRASKAGSTPRSISPLVDLYNAISIRHVVPFGAFDVDAFPSDAKIDLRYSLPGDSFHALDADAPLSPMPAGEMVYAVGSDVVTRHINWKQSRLGLVSTTSTNVVFMAEILADVPDHVLSAVTQELLSALESQFGAKVNVSVLSEFEMQVEL